MYGNIFNNSIIEVENETTSKELEALREAYPNSIILRENSQFLKLLYSKLNSINNFNELRNYINNFNKRENTKIEIESISRFEKINYGKFKNPYIDSFNAKLEKLYAGNSVYNLKKDISA